MRPVERGGKQRERRPFAVGVVPAFCPPDPNSFCFCFFLSTAVGFFFFKKRRISNELENKVQ